MFRFLILALASVAAFGQREDAGPARLGPLQRTTPAEMGLNETLLEQARNYALKGGGSGIVIFQGKQVYSWGDLKALYDLKSTTKSIGVTALGLALRDGKVKLDDKATKYLPDVPLANEGGLVAALTQYARETYSMCD